MMGKVIVAPSILSADRNNLSFEVAKMKKAGAAFIHLDVMDGKFVPNTTFGPELVARVSSEFSDIVKDTHLMIVDPLKQIPEFAKAGSDLITVHLESFDREEEVFEAIDSIHRHGLKAGLSIKPATAPEAIDAFLPKLDLVLVMSVEPGKGGQTFMENSLDKIAYFKKKRDFCGYSYLIEVDGGINAETAKRTVEAGVDVLVAGSYLYGHEDYEERVRGLLEL